MGILGRLFEKRKSQPYLDAGMALTLDLYRSLALPDWHGGLPDYTQEEILAIDHRLSQFQKMANEEMGGEAAFHPDAAPALQRMLAGEALAELAQSQSTFEDGIPGNWKSLVSTYLKAWASRLDPMTLLNLGDLLVRVGRRDKAMDVYRAVLLFPSYAKTLWGKDDPEMVANIVNEANESLRSVK